MFMGIYSLISPVTLAYAIQVFLAAHLVFNVHHKDGPKIQVAFVDDNGHCINQRGLRKTGDAKQETTVQLLNMLQIDPNSIEEILLTLS